MIANCTVPSSSRLIFMPAMWTWWVGFVFSIQSSLLRTKLAEHRRIDAFELWCWKRLLRVPGKEIRPAHPKGDQSWVFIGRNDATAEAPVLWPPHVKSWLIEKDFDAGKDWGQEKGTTEDEMAGWHHRRDGHEFEWTLGVGDGQGGLACCDSWGRKESDTTERLN